MPVNVDISMERNYALDFLKFVAAVLITNSHFIPVFKDVNVFMQFMGKDPWLWRQCLRI